MIDINKRSHLIALIVFLVGCGLIGWGIAERMQ